MTKGVCILCVLLLAVSCSGKPGGDSTGQAPGAGPEGTSATKQAAETAAFDLEIVPKNIDLNTALRVLPKGFNLPDAQIEWLVNGYVVASGYSFKPVGAKRGDSIQAAAKVQGTRVLSSAIAVGNAMPEFTRVKLMPEVFLAGDNLFMEAEAADPDGDAVEIRYEWKKNGEPAGKAKTIEAALKRGDLISIKLTACDMEGCSRPIVMNRQIGNMPPMFPKESPHTIEGGFFSQTMRALDPDDDPITYALKAGPEGMTIDAATGQVSWIVPADFSGRASYVVAASDGHGGVVTQTINVDIR